MELFPLGDKKKVSSAQASSPIQQLAQPFSRELKFTLSTEQLTLHCASLPHFDMRTSALLYGFAVAASVVHSLAVPAPAPQSLDEMIPEDDPNPQLGPAPGTALPDPEPSKSQIVTDVVDQLPPSKRSIDLDSELEKRGYTTLTLPPGWFYAYKDLNAATEHSSYKTYQSLDDTKVPDGNYAKACTNFCESKVGCTFCNLYTEKYGPNPEDQIIKCSLYSLPSGPNQATNDGQWRNGYRVTISHSYAFSKQLNPVVPGFTAQGLDGAINGKRTNPTDPDPYMGYASIEATDPTLCAAACDAKTAYNSRHPTSGTYRACNFFNFYILIKNDVPFKTICSFYLIPFDSSYATNHGYTSGSDTYTVGNSWSFARNALIGTGGIVTV